VTRKRKNVTSFREKYKVWYPEGKGREILHNISLKSMQRTIDQAEERIGLFSTKCEALNQVINELEGEKALQVSRGKDEKSDTTFP
jgi:hypothetical protein